MVEGKDGGYQSMQVDASARDEKAMELLVLMGVGYMV